MFNMCYRLLKCPYRMRFELSSRRSKTWGSINQWSSKFSRAASLCQRFKGNRVRSVVFFSEESHSCISPNSSLLTNHCACCLRWKKGNTGSCWVWCFEERRSVSIIRQVRLLHFIEGGLIRKSQAPLKPCYPKVMHGKKASKQTC